VKVHLDRRSALVGRLLDLMLEYQQEDMWCWAACAGAVSNYYQPRSGWTQCGVAAATLGRSDCCGAPSPCNTETAVDAALRATGTAVDRQPFPVRWQTIVQEIKRGRPVVVRVGYTEQGVRRGHFVVVDGYWWGGRVRVRDPATGSRLNISLGSLKKDYEKLAHWTHTYLTAPS
jgi:hypothetical protein